MVKIQALCMHVVVGNMANRALLHPRQSPDRAKLVVIYMAKHLNESFRYLLFFLFPPLPSRVPGYHSRLEFDVSSDYNSREVSGSPLADASTQVGECR